MIYVKINIINLPIVYISPIILLRKPYLESAFNITSVRYRYLKQNFREMKLPTYENTENMIKIERKP